MWDKLMQILYYHNNTQKIVYYYNQDTFDMDFTVPDCRIAYYKNSKLFDGDVKSFYYGWNYGITESPLTNDSVRKELDYLHHKCAAMHDVVRISNAMKEHLNHNTKLLFNSDEILFEALLSDNTNYINSEYNTKLNNHLNKIRLSRSVEEVKKSFKDFWVSTKNVDGYFDSTLNLYL